MLFLVRGIPGSGKSTKAKQLIQEGLADVHFEADMYFEVDGEYVFDPSKIKDAHAWCQKETDAALAAGKRVVVSNTFVKKWEAAVYFDMAAKHGVDVEVIVATGNYQNVHGVPAEVLLRMKDNWEEF